jgi:outer membrane protein assembly factor BamB
LVAALLVGLLSTGGVVALAGPSAASVPQTWEQAGAHHQTAARQHPKLAADLDPSSGGLNAAPATDSQGRVRVEAKGSDTAALQAAVLDAGGEIGGAADGAVSALVPADRLTSLSDDGRVAAVRSARTYKPDLISQGVAQTGAQTWLNAGKTGAGTKIAIVDLGFTNLASEQAAGRLPVTAITNNFCGSAGLNGNTQHGTAVAEVAHQMAPDAQLYLICFDFDTDLDPIVNYLQANGVTIVNASWGSVGFARGDGSGPPNSAEAAIAKGRSLGELWVFAAGNDGARHYNFTATDADNDEAVEPFHSASPVPGPDSQEIFHYTLAPGQVSTVIIKWDAWPTTNQAFDACWWVDSITDPNFVGCNLGDQNTNPGPPNLITSFTGVSGHSSYLMVIFRHDANTTIQPRMDVYFEGQEANLQAISASSVADPASSPSAFTIGAYNVNAPGSVESFSGEGPTIDGRIKPDMSGPDGVSNDIFNPFLGTSAAAPHVTGAAAVLKGVDPNLNATLLQGALQGMSIDAGPAGTDNLFGTGRLSLQPKAIGGPAAVTVSGKTLTFVRGSDGGLWERSASGAWSRLGGFLTSDLDVSAMPSGKLDVFGRGADSALWHIQSNDGGVTFGTWQSLGGLMASGPTAVSWGEGREDVLVKGVDGALWHRGFSNSAFEAWQSLGGLLSSDPTVSSWGVSRLDVFIRGNDSALWHLAWNGSTWSSWQGLGGVLGSGPGAVSVSFNTIDVFVRGSDGALWSRNWNGAVWSNWFGLGGGLVGDPDPAGTSTQLDVMIDGLDGGVWEKSRTNGVWPSGGALNGWVNLGAPGFPPVPPMANAPAGSVTTFQTNALHDGHNTGTLHTPLTEKWHHDFDHTVGYPLYVNGRIFVTVAQAVNGNFYGDRLYALDAATGLTLWGPVDVGGTYQFSGITADSVNVYSVNFDGLVQALDQKTGQQQWTAKLSQYAFSSPPTVDNGVLFVGGAGSGGTVYALDTRTGAVLWSVPVANGDSSSPVVTADSVYVSYACELSYRLNRTTGVYVWTHTTGCSGGGGRTPVLNGTTLYVRDDAGMTPAKLSIANGSSLGTFSATQIPAFDGTLGFFQNAGTLTMVDSSGLTPTWSTTGDSSIASAPVTIDGKVVVGSTTGLVSVYDEHTGTLLWSANAGQPVTGVDEHNAVLRTGLAAADGLLIVPATNRLIVYG